MLIFEKIMTSQRKHIKILWLLLLFGSTSYTSLTAQLDSLKYNAEEIILYKTSDSIPVVSLDSIIILPRLYFNNYRELKHFRFIRRKVYRVYPFAKLSGEDLEKLDKRLTRMTPHQRKRYMRIIKRWIKKTFEPKLKNLTQSEGRILSKLFHRQTGQTVYQFLKKYKSGWTAFWYQNMAKLYNIDLKVKFDPAHKKEDYWIEYILQNAFQEEILEPQPNKLGYKFIDLHNKWNDKNVIPKHLKIRNK